MGPKGPLDWQSLIEAVLPMLLYGLVFVIGIQLLVSEWFERPPGPRSPDDRDLL